MSIELAAAAVSLLSPYLADAGKEAAKTAGKEAAGAGSNCSAGCARD